MRLFSCPPRQFRRTDTMKLSNACCAMAGGSKLETSPRVADTLVDVDPNPVVSRTGTSLKEIFTSPVFVQISSTLVHTFVGSAVGILFSVNMHAFGHDDVRMKYPV